MRFEGKTALVSGAGSGIGRAVAAAFFREGANVVLLGRSAEKLARARDEIEAARAGAPARAIVAVARHEVAAEASSAVRSALRAFGRLDVLVNNAGAWIAGTGAETPSELWSEALAANLTGPFELSRAAIPALRAARGAIVNVSSTLAVQPLAGATPYCAAKAGLNMLTKTLALEEARHGVRVNAVAPGVVDTPIHRSRVGEDPQEIARFLDAMAREHPLGRVGRPEDVAAAVLYLASAEASWVTGAILAVDGGISLA